MLLFCLDQITLICIVYIGALGTVYGLLKTHLGQLLRTDGFYSPVFILISTVCDSICFVFSLVNSMSYFKL